MLNLNEAEKQILANSYQGNATRFDLDSKKNPKTTIRAEILNRLLLELPLPDLENQTENLIISVTKLGIQIEGVVVEGVVNLSHSSGNRNRTLFPLQFKNCHFLGDGLKEYDNASKRPIPAFNGKYCHFSELSFEDCKIGYVDISYSKFEKQLKFDGITGFKDNGICRINASNIYCSNNVKICNTKLQLLKNDFKISENPKKNGAPPSYALQLDNASIRGYLFLRPHLEVIGGINIGSAEIDRDIWLDGAKIKSKNNNAAIRGQYANVKGVLGLTSMRNIDFPEKNIETTNEEISRKSDTRLEVEGSVKFLNARIGSLSITGADFQKQKEGDLFFFNLCEIGQLDIYTSRGEGITANYPVSFKGCQIQKSSRFENILVDTERNVYQLDFTNIQSNSDIKLANIRCDNIIFNNSKIDGEFSITKSEFSYLISEEIEVKGSVIVEARISRELDFSGSSIRGDFWLGSEKSEIKPLQIKVWKDFRPKVKLEDTKIGGCLSLSKKIELVSLEKIFWQDEITVLKRTPLEFYPDWSLMEAIYESREENKVYSIAFLISKKSSRFVFSQKVLLDGQSMAIHNINRQNNLKIETPSKAIDYLKFFCSNVWGEEGPFRIIESEDELKEYLNNNLELELEQTDLSDVEKIAQEPEVFKEIVPVSIVENKSTDAYWYARAYLLYGGVLFKADFKIFLSGMIEMENDEQLRELKNSLEITYNAPFREVKLDGYISGEITLPSSANITNSKWKNITGTESHKNISRYLDSVIETPKIEDETTYKKPIIDLRHLKARGLNDANGYDWGNVYLQLDGFEYDFFKTNITPGNQFREDTKPQNEKSNRLKLFIKKLYHRIIDRLTFKFTYRTTEEQSNRLKWLNKQFENNTPTKKEFTPQPFEQVVKVLKRKGENKFATNILIYKLRLNRIVNVATWEKPIYWIWDRCFGFGIKTRVVLRTFLLVFLVGWVFTYIANSGKIPFYNKKILNPVLVVESIPVANSAVEFTKANDSTLQPGIPTDTNNFAGEIPCKNQIEPILYALDLFIPLLDLKQSSECRISKHEDARVWRILKGGYSILGWIITSILIISLTGFFKREVER